MSRKVPVVVAVALAFVVGFLLGPAVFRATQLDADDPATTSTSTPPVVTATPPVTVETEGHTPSSTPTTLSEQEQADRLAGVRVRSVPDSSSGELRVVTGDSPAPGGDAPVTAVRVEVEEGLDIDDQAFASFVMTTLNDPRSWVGDGSVRFSRTDGDADIRVVLATPTTVDSMCAPLATNGKWSCGRYGHAALNADRWVFGADAWADGGGSLTEYRHYLVNHEVGHLLGHPHERCPVAGQPAPVMVQQSISLQGCEPNGWPFP
jgi:Protein of unknown function (DUF3152)